MSNPSEAKNERFLVAFFWLPKNLAYLGFACLLMTYTIIEIKLLDRKFDQLIGQIFPGLIAISKNSLNPEFWRLFIFTYFIAGIILQILWLRQLLKTSPSLISFRDFWKSKNWWIGFLSGGLISTIVIWSLLFSTKVWQVTHISRGAILMQAMLSHYLGLALGMWIFLCCLSIGLAALYLSLHVILFRSLKNDR